MDYTTRGAARRDRRDLVPVSPGFKLILVRPVERSVATGFPCEHGQESCVLYAPLAAFTVSLSSITERKAKRNAGLV